MRDQLRGLLFALLTACVPSSSPPPQYGPAPYGAQPQAQPDEVAANGATCIEIFQCLAACTDQSCFQPCYERGTPDAQASAAALINCNQTGGACEAELTTCRGAPLVAATPAASSPVVATSGKRAPVANDQILPWLTGSWIGNNHQFEFYGDGRVRRSNGGMMVEKRPGERASECVAVANDTGTVTQQGDLLIMTFGATDGYTCGIRESSPGVTVRYRIEWVDNPYYELNELQLYFRDIDCTAGDMWCNDKLRRR